MSDDVGRRPEGPGWYWYTGPGRRAGSVVSEPVYVFELQEYDGNGRPDYVTQLVDCMTLGESGAEHMPGEFTPLYPPVAAPEPSWADAPEWAMWTTVDATGMRQWWGNEPPGYSILHATWINGEYPGKYAAGGRIDLPLGVDWRTTLRKRPEVGDE